MGRTPWAELLYLKPSDFKHPDDLDPSVVIALDRFIHVIGIRPTILDDVRPNGREGSQHTIGRAIDAFFGRIDPIKLWRAALNAKLFTGLGIYVNEQGVPSFHFDTRVGDTARGYWIDRTPDNPATWGGKIEHPYDESSGTNVKQIAYVGADEVIDILKKKGPLAAILIAALLYVLYQRSQNS